MIIDKKIGIKNRDLVDVKCDICGNIKKIEYRSYLKNIKKYPIYCCNASCAKIKENQTKKKLYGDDYELNRVLKMKKTNKERYGDENSSKIFRNEKKLETFIKELKNIYGEHKFNYLNINYINNYTSIEIECKKHGKIKVRPIELLAGRGCKECNKELKKEEIFKKHINKSNIIHSFKYDYSKTKYVNNSTKCIIICPIHGEFKQRLADHSNGKGCSKCSNISRRLKTIERINKNIIEGNQITPNYNRKACEMFDNISKNKNINIKHALNGGEYYIPHLGYWVDGYDEINNVVYEYYEKDHYIKGKLKDRDKNREKEIKKFLKCKIHVIKD